MDLEYSKLSDKELSERLSKLNKRIAYASRTHIHSSALPQMRQIQAHLIIEARGRLEKTKVDLYNKFFPGESKIIGEEDNDETGK
tara:strand:- start:1605 stop:1859 length:255 start_codon:yes stop_codon:yes gene_type:complete